MLKRSQIEAEFTVVNGRITNPGKFEGEAPFAPAFWSVGLDGFADDTDHDEDAGLSSFSFRINADDVREWPELAGHSFTPSCPEGLDR